MTEYDRGAYTPQADAPLAFDARGPRDRRPMPMTLVASGVVLLVIVGALFLAYRGGVKGGAETPRPVGEPIGAIKTAAAPGAGSGAVAQAQDPTAGIDLYAAQNVPNAKPTFAPSPEEPAPRPVARLVTPPAPQLRVQTVSPPNVRIETADPVVATAPPVPAATAIHAGAADHVAPLASRPIQTAALTAPTPRPTPVTPKAPAAAKLPAAKTVEIAAGGASAKAVDASPASAGGSMVQIGAFSSKALADKGYADVSGLMSGAMSGKRQHVEPVAHGDKTVFRTTIGGFADHAAAKAFCATLAAKGHTCFVKG